MGTQNWKATTRGQVRRTLDRVVSEPPEKGRRTLQGWQARWAFHCVAMGRKKVK